MFLDIVGVITTSKLSILSTFQGGAPGAPPMSSRVKNHHLKQSLLVTLYLLFPSLCIFIFQVQNDFSFHL